jgi:hypothetical protein
MTHPARFSHDARDLRLNAEAALDEARKLSPGSEKTAALKEAGLLRNAAFKHNLYSAKRGRPAK